MHEDLPRASDYQPEDGEANFGPPIDRQVVGGMHIAPECVTYEGDEFIMLTWPNGLPRHETERTVRFPHGLMRFGETLTQTAERLVGEQLGMSVESVRVVDIDSYVDEQGHWHIEPLLIVAVSGEPKPHEAVGDIIRFSGTALPDDSLWTKEEFADFYTTYFSA